MSYSDPIPRPPGGQVMVAGPLRSHVYITGDGGRGGGPGFFGSLAIGFAFVLGLALFVVALAVIAVVFVAAVVVALLALGVNHLLVALSPRYRERRDAQGRFQPTARIIETTAKVIDTTRPRRRT
jgi:hypothetical protein